MFKPIALILFALCAAQVTKAQTQYALQLDPLFSPKSSAEDIVTIHRAITGVEDKYLPPKLWDEKRIDRKALGIGYRLAKTVFVDNVVDHVLILAQHEIFGHGFRYREYGRTNNSYQINLPPPYGNGGGRARSSFEMTDPVISRHESVLISASGNEANNVLAKTLTMKWVHSGSIHHGENMLFIESQNNQLAYILITKFLNGEDGGDIESYIFDVNLANAYAGSKTYDLDRLVKQSAVTLLNPFQLYTAFGLGINYILLGRESTKVPMIKFGNARYLPALRIGLGPWGSEFYFENYLKLNSRMFNGYARYGDPVFFHHWGAGINAISLVNSKHWMMDASADIWQQPYVLVGGDQVVRKRVGVGGASTVTGYLKLFQRSNAVNLKLQLGYKTLGYMEGETLRENLICRFGLSFALPEYKALN